MGTRGLTIIKIDGETKVAQYGQWDHYPSGQGLDILRGLHKINEAGEMDAFKQRVRALSWLTDAQIEELNKSGDWGEKHPYLSRDCGGGIVGEIMAREILGLVDNSDFAEDGLFCEGIFTIDLDAGTYTACGQTFQLSELPDEETFLAAFKQDED